MYKINHVEINEADFDKLLKHSIWRIGMNNEKMILNEHSVRSRIGFHDKTSSI